MKEESYKFTKEDFDACEWYYKYYFIDVLNGDYDLDQARADLFGLIGSQYDKRMIEPVEAEKESTHPECKDCSYQNSENCNTCDVLNPQFR